MTPSKEQSQFARSVSPPLKVRSSSEPLSAWSQVVDPSLSRQRLEAEHAVRRATTPSDLNQPRAGRTGDSYLHLSKTFPCSSTEASFPWKSTVRSIAASRSSLLNMTS